MNDVITNFKSYVTNYVASEDKEKGLVGKSYSLSLYCLEDDMVGVRVDAYREDVGILARTLYSDKYQMADIVSNPDIAAIMNYFFSKDIAIDSFRVRYNFGTLANIFVNGLIWYNALVKGYCVRNNESEKLEMHFDKEGYQRLRDEYKKKIKSLFLFSRYTGAWISRHSEPNLNSSLLFATDVLGLEYRGRQGEVLTFEEKLKRDSDRSMARAMRYEEKAKKAEERGEALQSRFKEYSKDIAFVTQPNINSSAGRSFTRFRERVLRQYEKGFEEFKKSDYYKEKSRVAVKTASNEKLNDKVYLLKKIEACKKDIDRHIKTIEKYNSYTDRLNNGEVLHKTNGELLRPEDVSGWCDDVSYKLDAVLSAYSFYSARFEELGGYKYSKENVKKGSIIIHARWGRCDVLSAGPKNIRYRILEGGAKGMTGTCPYAEIESVEGL